MVLNLLRVEEINPEYMLEKSFYQFQHYRALPGVVESKLAERLENVREAGLFFFFLKTASVPPPRRNTEAGGGVPRDRDPQRGERGHLLQDPPAAGQAGKGNPGVHPQAQILLAFPAARAPCQGYPQALLSCYVLMLNVLSRTQAVSLSHTIFLTHSLVLTLNFTLTHTHTLTPQTHLHGLTQSLTLTHAFLIPLAHSLTHSRAKKTLVTFFVIVPHRLLLTLTDTVFLSRTHSHCVTLFL